MNRKTYKTINADNLPEFDEECNKLAGAGWFPEGNMIMVMVDGAMGNPKQYTQQWSLLQK